MERKLTVAPPEITYPKVVLVVVAHPDDADFGAGGTIAKWISEGVEVHYCLASSGGAGGFDTEIDRDLIPAIRESEQRRAAEIYGVHSIEFLGFSDGFIEANLKLRGEISRVIRTIRPDTVLCQSPERNYQRIQASHPDHLATGEATLRSVYPDARNPFAFPELLEKGLEPHIVSQVFMMAGPNHNFVSDISLTINDKIAALLEHKSQIKDPDALGKMIMSSALNNAREASLAPGVYAELFQVIKIA